MNYFNCALLLKRNTPYRSFRIYSVVYGKDMKAYAKKIYGANFEDALDRSYRHILENYDPNKGDLEHYVISVIHKINRNIHKNEIGDEAADLAMDELAFKENNGDPLEEYLEKQRKGMPYDVENCVKYLLKYYIIDFKYFTTNKSSDKINSYSELFENFSIKSIKEAVEYIKVNYQESIEDLYAVKRIMRFKAYPRDRYMEAFDTSVEYLCDFRGIVVYKRPEAKTGKVIYEIDLKEILNRFKKIFYSGILNRNIGGLECYISLSGKLSFSEAEAMDNLETEIVGSILSRLQQMGVMLYEKGTRLLMTASSPMSRTSMVLSILDRPFPIEMRHRVAKLVRR